MTVPKEQMRLMNLSLGVAIVLLIAKVTAAILTGSSAVYSDAAESVVHLLVVAFGSYALRIAHKPADQDHHYGHDKVNYLSSGFEGGMISVAALLIFYQAIQQLIQGVKLEHIGLGITVTAGAAAVNLVLGLALLAAAKRHNSPLLKANGHHVLTDVWSSAAVLVALMLIKLTGWLWWDPVAAVIAAANILRVGLRLFVESLAGLLDASDPQVETNLRKLLDEALPSRGATYHNLRHRYSGKIHWVELHLVVDDFHSVRSGHQLATEIEAMIAAQLKPEGRVITHLEPKSAETKEEDWEVP